jgi:hypothetical protein
MRWLCVAEAVAAFLYSQVKSHLRRRRGPSAFTAEIARAFAEVGRANVVAYYQACIEDVV